jgi:hypothetical protein
MRSIKRRIIPWLAALTLAVPACQQAIDDPDVSDNLPAIVTFTPLTGESDVTDLIVKDDPATAINEQEAVFRADKVTVTIQGNPRNSFASGFASDVIFTSYTVQYAPLDGLAPALIPPAWNAGINQTVPAGGAVTFDIEIVRLIDKEAGPLTSLDCTIGVGICDLPRRAIATVNFDGADISGHPVVATGLLTITFADFGDAEGADQGLL